MNDSTSADNTQRQSVRPAVVFLVMAAIILVAVAALVLWKVKSTPPRYSAEATLLVMSSPRAYEFDESEVKSYRRIMHLESARIVSGVNLTQVLEQQDVQATQWYRRHATHDDALATLRRIVVAEPMLGTAVLKVTVTTDQPDEAALLANAVVENYLNHHAPRDEELGDPSRSHNMLVRLGSWARLPKQLH